MILSKKVIEIRTVICSGEEKDCQGRSLRELKR